MNDFRGKDLWPVPGDQVTASGVMIQPQRSGYSLSGQDTASEVRIQPQGSGYSLRGQDTASKVMIQPYRLGAA